MSLNVDYNLRPDYDEVIQDIANYVINYKVVSDEALTTARNCRSNRSYVVNLFLQLRHSRRRRMLAPSSPALESMTRSLSERQNGQRIKNSS